jgi:hypothetical protein
MSSFKPTPFMIRITIFVMPSIGFVLSNQQFSESYHTFHHMLSTVFFVLSVSQSAAEIKVRLG